MLGLDQAIEEVGFCGFRGIDVGEEPGEPSREGGLRLQSIDEGRKTDALTDASVDI